MKPLLTLAALSLAAIGIWIESSHIRAWSFREQAERAYYDGNFDNALARYERVLDLRPGEPRSYTDAADSISQYLNGSGQRLPADEFEVLARKAVLYYLLAIDSGPPSAWSYARLALLSEALRSSRSRDLGVDLARLTGNTATLQPEDRLSEVAWAKAVQIEPRNFYYRDFLGDFYLRRGFVSRAVEHLRYAVRLHPVADRHYYLSDYATVSPVVAQAVEAGVQDALEAEDTFVSEYDIHRFLASLYLELDRVQDAIKSLEAARSVAPLPHAVDVQIGQILANAGDDAGALRAFRRAAEQEPEYARAWLILGVTLSRVGEGDEGLEALYRARSLAPGDYSTSMALARTLAAAGKLDEATATLEHVVLNHEDKPVAYMELVELYEKQGRFTEATRIARRLVARYPDEEVYRRQLEQLEEASGAQR